MPLACFDTIRKFSTHLKHAEGESTEKVEKRDFEPLETAYYG